MKSSIEQVKSERKYVQDTIYTLQNNIAKESDEIQLLANHEKHLAVIQELYENASSNKLYSLDSKEYISVTAPLSTTVTLLPMYELIWDVTKNIYGNTTETYNMIHAATPLVSAAATTASFNARNQKTVFPSGEIIIKKHNIEIKIDNDIEYIRTQISQIEPNITDDFNHFLRVYYAFETTPSSYQEFMGVRSVLFMKLIFQFVDNNYGPQTKSVNGTVLPDRWKYIEKFIFGSNNAINTSKSAKRTSEPIIKNARNLYSELSSQDTNYESVKLGNTQEEYIKDLFVRIIEAFTSVLRLRKSYYSK